MRQSRHLGLNNNNYYIYYSPEIYYVPARGDGMAGYVVGGVDINGQQASSVENFTLTNAFSSDIHGKPILFGCLQYYSIGSTQSGAMKNSNFHFIVKNNSSQIVNWSYKLPPNGQSYIFLGLKEINKNIFENQLKQKDLMIDLTFDSSSYGNYHWSSYYLQDGNWTHLGGTDEYTFWVQPFIVCSGKNNPCYKLKNSKQLLKYIQNNNGQITKYDFSQNNNPTEKEVLTDQLSNLNLT